MDQDTDQDKDHDTLQDMRPRQDAETPVTKSVRQYMRLHDHIERLREDKRPSSPGTLSPEDARAYQMAARFRAAAAGAATPDPAFVASLRARIQKELAAATTMPPASNLLAAAERRLLIRPIRTRSGVSRRTLIGVGLSTAAAGLAAGVALGRLTEPAPSRQQPSVALVPPGAGIWVAVAAAHDIPLGGVRRFATDAIVGFVRHTPSGFSALSGVCSHMGCLLTWNTAARTYDCPCHGRRFAEDGSAAPTSPAWNRPLAQIATRVEGGTVEVYIPATAGPTGGPLGGNPSARDTVAGYHAGK